MFNKIVKVINKLAKVTKKELPLIMEVSSLSLTTIAVISTAQNTFKASDALRAKKVEKGDEVLTNKEKVGTVWKFYIFPFVATAGSIATSIIGHCESRKRIISLSTALNTATIMHSTYKEDIQKALGEEKYNELREKISEEKTKKQINDIPEDLVNHDGLLPCKDLVTGKWFRTSPERIYDARSKARARVNSEMWSSLYDLYYDMGAVDEAGPIYENIGFNTPPNIIVSHECVSDNGTSYITIDYDYDICRNKYGDL